jgi:DNA polymerase III alpha subunit
MINLRVRTEFSFRYAYGKISEIISSQQEFAAITDRFNTFGHIPFFEECKKQNKKPILGVELAFCEDATLKVRQVIYFVVLLAKNQQGLSEIYKLVSKSTKQKYYVNRLSFSDLSNLSENIITIISDSKLEKELDKKSESFYGISPTTNYFDFKLSRLPKSAISDNLYDKPISKNLYQIIIGSDFENRTEPSHILSEVEWKNSIRFLSEAEKEQAVTNTYSIANKIEKFNFPKAELPKSDNKKTLLELCNEGKLQRKKLQWNNIYEERLNYEIDLIKQKNFEDYFYIVYDLVKFAKSNMLVGCARGSSAGSIVCYLLGITDIDPIPFNLIFERFIDVNRQDLPDIDIDFQDTKREMLLDYLKEKYGADCVAKLGTISQYKPKSIITELSKVLQIPQWEIKDLKDAIIERSDGDARASNCLEDTFNDLEIGKDFIKKYPKLNYSKFIEGHSRHFGQHAAAIVVADKSLENYCSIDYSVDGCQLDKIDAESVNLLKMDCLGLRTLSVIQDCLDIIGKDREWMIDYPLDDQKAFDVINSRKFYGIFQFEGQALISIAKQINIKNFEDVSAITALARPGPLISGGTTQYIKAKNNNCPEYLPHCEEYTKDTHGVIVYQEQVMQIVRNIGQLSWEDTSTIRKAMSKSYGKEFFDKFFVKFRDGAKSKFNIDADTAEKIWNKVNTMGSWAFNKSHSIAYGMISYWCMVLKAHHPLEFALATLKNAKDEEQVVQILKELAQEGYEYKPFDKDLSEIDWSIKDGKLIGGFINIKGVGQLKAKKMIEKRNKNTELTVAEKKLLFNAETPFDILFEFNHKFSEFYQNWDLFFKNKPMLVKEIIDKKQDVRFLAKTISATLRDCNESININKRGGKVIKDGCLKFLDLKMQDDTDSILCRISRENFEEFGSEIINKNKIGDYYLVQGSSLDGFRYVMIKKIKKITPEQILEKINKNREIENN